MPIIDPTRFEGTEFPELIFGFVAPVGTPLAFLANALTGLLRDHGYDSRILHLSDFLEGLDLPTASPAAKVSEYERIDTLMTRGNELRQRLGGGEALAMCAAAEISSHRGAPPLSLPQMAHVLNQLKHPDEAVWLRRIYGASFSLIAVYCDEDTRRNQLKVHKDMTQDEIDLLILRDEREEIEHGQHVAETFQHADVFVDIGSCSDNDTGRCVDQLKRYLDLLFGHQGISPNRDEYGMFLAQAAAYRSADLSRQVGASILAPCGDFIALGTNEVPAPDGGQYWAGTLARRDVELGYDANAVMQRENIQEMLAVITDRWNELSVDEQDRRLTDALGKLQRTRLMNLTEFGRAVHAEMAALLSAGRLGVSARGCELYCTTFPCHNCTKHLVAAGIRRVVYIEPYPKSLASRLHKDAIVLGKPVVGDRRTTFVPFCGVAPRAYSALFASITPEGIRIKKKDAEGNRLAKPAGLRIHASAMGYVEREALAATYLTRLVEERSKNAGEN